MTAFLDRVLKKPIAGVALLLLALYGQSALADSGFYVGGSIGTANTNIKSDDFRFDENDSAWKAYGGFNFDIVVIDLAVEGGYVDFGKPSGNVGGIDVEFKTHGLDAFLLGGLELGPIGVFAKAGFIRWNADLSAGGFGTQSDDGTDPAYGVGARFSLGSLELRAEYERFDIKPDGAGSSDQSLASLGVVWTF